jgi:hypothetical protein
MTTPGTRTVRMYRPVVGENRWMVPLLVATQTERLSSAMS